MKNGTLNVERLMWACPEEWTCLLGMLGFAAKYIAEEVGIGESTVYHYLSKRQIKLSDYRNGRTALARQVARLAKYMPVRNPMHLSLERTLFLPKPKVITPQASRTYTND